MNPHSKMRRACTPRPSGFTLVELLTAIGIIALLAALLFPVFAQVREKGRQTACTSNLKQIGAAVFAYMQDYDETIPNGKIPDTIFPKHAPLPTNSGWAGRVFPYLKNAAVLHCPDDPTDGDGAHKAVAVSYGMNWNMATAPQAASWTAPARTVLFCEMENNTARVFSPDEQVSGNLSYPFTTSPAGNGYGTWDLGSNLPPDNAPNKGYITRYATGYIDNHEDADALEAWVFGKNEGRHSDGANYLASDGHTLWLKGASVSAGYNAPAPGNPQSHTACKNNGGAGGFPCAEGTGVATHALTFSTKQAGK